MDLVQRSYSGHSFRPRPLVEENPATQTFIVVTSWGAPEHSQKVADLIKEHMNLSEDADSTNVGTFVQGLTDEGNRLRAAAQIANQYLYKNENSREYSAAVELALISVRRKVLSWVQIGNPHLILSTPKGIEPLCYSPDWSWQLQQSSPLVGKALGLERTCNLNCGSYRLQGEGDEKLMLIARSAVPGNLYTLKKIDLMMSSQLLVEDNSEAPFWLGILDLKS